MNSLKEKTAVVTGASSGIGRATALSLAAMNMNLCLLGRNMETLEEVALEAGKSANQVLCYSVDLTSNQDIRKVAGLIKKEYSCVDVIVHSAGIISFGSLESASLEDFDRQFSTNVRAPYALTQALLPMLRECKGQVVFINSSIIHNAGPGVGQYAATKFALKAVADSFRQEVNAEGIRVLSVYPGRTATPMQTTIYEMEGKDYRPERLMQPEDVAALIVNALTLPYTAEITEIDVRPLVKS